MGKVLARREDALGVGSLFLAGTFCFASWDGYSDRLVAVSV